MKRSLRSTAYFLFACSLLTFSSAVPFAQGATPAAENGKFRLHKFEQPIGEETYTINHEKNGRLTLKSDFLFTDRGTKVPLTASLRTSGDYTPRSFVITGNTSRISKIDTDVEINGANATVRQGKETRTIATPQQFVAISGYAPVAIQMTMMRYWRTHGMPAKLAMLPSGEVQIQARGAETVEIDGHTIQVERYSVRGLIWGLETLWMDRDNNLVALVSTDAEFDHFEAVRDEDEAGLPKFVASAARDEMAELGELSQKLSGRRTGVLLLTGATVIDGTGKPPMKNMAVLVRDGKIAAIEPQVSGQSQGANPGHHGKLKVPADAQRIDVSGKYIIPGLWDMHAHYEQVEWGPIYLAAGVTTVRDVGNEFDFITAVRDAVNSGKALGPHMLLAGIVDGDSPMAVGITRVNSPADAEMWVTRYHNANFQQMKIYSSVKPDNVKAICTDAHKVGMTVTGHIPNGMTAYEGVDDGMDQINHIHYVMDMLAPKDYDWSKVRGIERLKMVASLDPKTPAGQQAVDFLKQHHTVIDPTMALTEMGFHPASTPLTEIEPGAARIAPELREALMSTGMPPDRAELGQQIIEHSLEMIGALHRAGVPIVVGTDQAVPGFSVYREMELYVKAGFTPMEALQAATLVPAQAMKVEAESGTVEVGKRADLAILDANPLENIHNIRSVRSVVANGVYYESAPLWESVGFSSQ